MPQTPAPPPAPAPKCQMCGDHLTLAKMVTFQALRPMVTTPGEYEDTKLGFRVCIDCAHLLWRLANGRSS